MQNIVVFSGAGISAESSLHERAGSKNVLHLHGEIMLAAYPAASLLQFVRPDVEKFIVTPDAAETPHRNFVWLKQTASIGAGGGMNGRVGI